MKNEYDFSRAERGKFYRPNARLRLPVYLDQQALRFVMAIAERRKKDVSAVASELIKSDRRIARIIR